MAFRYSYTRLSEETEDTEGGLGVPQYHQRRLRDPEAHASWFSYLFLYWLDPLFWLGFRHELEHSDLYPHPADTDSRRLLKSFNKHWRRELARRPGERARLWLVVARCMWWQLIVTGVMLFFQVASLVTQSILVGELANYFTIVDPTDKETRHAYLSATGIVVLSLCVAVYFAQAILLATKIGMMTRIMLTAAIYQKVLRLSQATLGSQSVGRIVTLASNDVQRFDFAFILLHYIWISMISLCVSTLLIYFHVGWSAFLAVAIIFVLEPTEAFLTWLYTEVRVISGAFTDERVKTMNEIITGMKVIKMYAWEYAFGRIVKKLRRKEAVMVFLATLIQLSATYLTWITFPPILCFAIFVPYTALGGELSPRIVFTTLSLLTFLTVHLSNSLQGILRLAEGLVGIRRIKELLLLEELPPIARSSSFQSHSASSSESSSQQKPGESIPLLHESSYVPSLPSLKDEPSDPFIRVTNVSVFYGENLVLENLSFEMDHNSSPLAVVGPVGSGKSTLLQCLIGELRPVEGSVEVCGRVSYASQQPWVYSGTVRDNVLFGLPYRKDWYNTVVQACTLDKDFEQLVDGDQTLVGERGAALSGGQKQRVNLARAIYNEADIYLLDDPLSAVDAAVAKHLFEKAICGLLKDKLVVLVTHHTYFALQAKGILDIEDGKVKTCDPTSLPHGLSKLEEAESEFAIGVSEDTREAKAKPRTSISETQTSLESVIEESPTTLYSEDRARGSIPISTYYRYFRAGGNHFFLLLVGASFLIGEGSVVLADLWLSDWAQCSSKNTSVFQGSATCKFSVDERIEIYSGILGFAIILNFAKTAAFSYLCVNASRVLHNRMFSNILRAPMRFFDTCPSGSMLNRFSMDIGLLDTITYRYYLCLLLFMELTAVMVLATVLNYWLLFAVAALVFLILSLRWYYISTAQNIKRLEAVARSPLYSHISTTLQGLPTIRIFGKEYIASNLFHQFLNSHTQAWWLYLASVRWFSMRVDLISALFTAVVAFTSLPLASVLDAGLVGLGLTYTISLADNLQLCVRISCEVENYMVSAERIMEYTKLETEASLETQPPKKKPPPNWPDQGRLEMHGVSFRYASDLPLTLNTLTLTVEPREKVGIVGRTGAGKSSLLSVLFRMAEPLGKVIIDGINIQEIGLHDLRKNISIIPQDPVLFSGSLRYNLDPFDEYSDEEVWDALEQVQLKLVIENLDNQLQGQVSEGATNFSVGQRQLVCLARALLRRNKILVLDEATANVDRKTDGMIQQIIQTQFVQCTVLTIAHRLDTVMDADRILVMDKGCVSEFGPPHLLLQNPASHLKRMVDKTGPDASQKLHQMAVDAHQRRQGLQ